MRPRGSTRRRLRKLVNDLVNAGPDDCEKHWRRRPDLNRGWRFCRPLPYHLATAPAGNDVFEQESSARVYAQRQQRRSEERNIISSSSSPPSHLRCLGRTTSARLSERKLERETRFEPATSTLARSHSTTELFPPATNPKRTTRPFGQSRQLV